MNIHIKKSDLLLRSYLYEWNFFLSTIYKKSVHNISSLFCTTNALITLNPMENFIILWSFSIYTYDVIKLKVTLLIQRKVELIV